MVVERSYSTLLTPVQIFIFHLDAIKNKFLAVNTIYSLNMVICCKLAHKNCKCKYSETKL